MMRWHRQGKVFDPAEHRLPAGCASFAQSPQAWVGTETVRVFFSTRRPDRHGGKVVSEVVWVDLDRDFGRVRAVATAPSIELGGRGCFDEHGIFPMHVMQDGERLRAYTSGWSRRQSVSVETAIGLAFSDDGGRSFQRHGTGPVFTASLHEPFLVGDPFVLRIGAEWHMWYIHGVAWRTYTTDGIPERVYKIAHASSTDGVCWRPTGKQGLIDDVLPDEAQALPTVIALDGRYHMVFCFRHAHDFRTNPSRGYRLGYAWSTDLRTWHRDDEVLGLVGAPGEWDADMQCYPHWCRVGDDVYLLYNGNAFGREGFGVARLEAL
jgi:hypothetical protein